MKQKASFLTLSRVFFLLSFFFALPRDVISRKKFASGKSTYRKRTGPFFPRLVIVYADEALFPIRFGNILRSREVNFRPSTFGKVLLAFQE